MERVVLVGVQSRAENAHVFARANRRALRELPFARVGGVVRKAPAGDIDGLVGGIEDFHPVVGQFGGRRAEFADVDPRRILRRELTFDQRGAGGGVGGTGRGG